MKGKYYVELYDGDRRRSLCLRTDNYELACQRYAAGLKELRKKIRAEHEAAKPQERLAWLPEEVEAIKDRYEDHPAFSHPQEIALDVLGRPQWADQYDDKTDELKDKRAQRLAEQIAGIERITWDDLVENSRTIRRRLGGKDYGKAWLKNIRTILSTVDFEPERLTPQRIRRWLDEQEKRGIGAVTMKNRASALQGLIEKAITSGFRPQLAPNPFKQVAFSVSKEVEKRGRYYCPTVEDYQKLFHEVLPEQPERIRLGIELLCFTGCRISAAPFLSTSSDPGWLDVPDVDGTKGGGRTPVPMEIWIRGRDTKISVHKLNKVLREVNPKLTNHGLRSGFKMLARRAGIAADVSESLLMHKLQKLEAVYGGDRYPDEALKPAGQKIWAELEQLLMKSEETN